MDIRFNCPHRGQHLTVDESGAGMAVNCPSCEAQIEIPSDTAPQAPSDEEIDTQQAA
jgi:transcription elongation factor Elf1